MITRGRATLGGMKPMTLAVLCVLAIGLSGCGNKGSLVLPTAAAPDAPPLDAPAADTTEPEAINEQNPEPVQGEGSEGGDTTPPPVTPAR